MEYRMLGRSGLKVSLHTLGTMNFDGEGFFTMPGATDRTQSQRLVDIAIEHGVNIFDTSNAYTRGKSESALGALLKGKSNDLLVETKVRFSMGDGPNQQGLSRSHIIEQCEASLKRLQRDRIDLYLIHEWDGLTPIEETMEALTSLVRHGKVRYIGCSNLSAWHIMKSMMVAERHNLEKFIVQQIHYTIEAREAEYELMPVALDQGVGIQVWSPIAGGLLSGKFRRDKTPEASRHLSGWTEPPIRDQERLWRIIDALVEVGDAQGVSGAQVALAWLAGRPGVASLVIGARNEAQLKDSLSSVNLKLTDAERAKLDDVSLLPLTYPYWHQFNSVSDRLSPPDLALHAPHIAKRAAEAKK
ncbi:aldo/keto reductase [Aestuariivirga litoralis]|uniref:aldo/keto reductase n=1 Tax=Aestuariivirga litoralis TaxID=2650924 RepID=UPI0018C54E2B|nr:aldo/keto reductase [Aestuariivirga litoralis]MBG1232684.1 aldo/keto reductase [Aestuariivirga litoralis]